MQHSTQCLTPPAGHPPRCRNSAVWLLSALLLLLPLQVLAMPAISSNGLTHLYLPGAVELSVQPAEVTRDQLADTDFHPLPRDQHNIVTRQQAIWLRFRLDNRDASQAFNWLLHHQSTQLDHLIVHVRDRGGPWHQAHLTDQLGFNQRALPYRKLAFAHSTPAGSQTEVYVQLFYQTSDSVTAAVHLWQRQQFETHAHQENLVFGIYYGVMLTLILITLLFTAVLRESSFFHYALFLLSSTLMWAILNGFAYQYLWPGNTFLHNQGYHLVLLLFSVAALQFSKAFLNTRDLLPTIHRLFSAAQLLALAATAIRLSGVYRPAMELSVFSLALLALLPFATWRAYRRGVDQVLWYAIAWIVYGGGLVFSLINNLTGWLPQMPSTDVFQAASLAQALVLTLAMGERLLRLDRDRRHAIELANQDPLTGLGNRRLLAREFEAMRLKFHRNGIPVFLILLDVDHFKAINDRHGHDAGDHVICDTANLLLRLSRAGDICVRFGGEEFALLLQAESPATALDIAERIRTQFAANPTFYNHTTLINHTLSAGIAPVMSSGRELSLKEMIARADGALYRAKASGRNRCVLADDED